ncbi:hypothetical protein ACG83_07320 [Frankia sp. R43]|uniref:hypothetical protein n=1 Tax=Frankia sp. R43 TaxID=269536 RepID=UPI0006C9F170|nr:hypothetical protein [Frankia sp. R43]KPM57483.1 hypothetical protein ACG83_07320 [Frankia sp. R43]
MPLIAGSAHDAARRADGLDAIRACPTPQPGSDGTHPTRPGSDRPSRQQRTGHRDTCGLGYPGGFGKPGSASKPGGVSKPSGTRSPGTGTGSPGTRSPIGVGNPGGTRSPGDRQPASGQSGHCGPGGATTAGH